jgi:L-ascorbate metabolism protein UlaG (beta-lactamase superfamily)
MKLTWFGTAGFRIETEHHSILIDPYFTRNEKADPEQQMSASDIEDTNFIFISHGHFDHIYDVPKIASNTNSIVYCGQGVDGTLIHKGLSKDLIHRVVSDGEYFDFDGLGARAFYSKHVKFDRWLLIKTLARINFRLSRYLPLLREYPEGQVLSWRFTTEGRVIHHFGSGGSSQDELEKLGEQSTDILLVPMQGHTHIDKIAHKYVKALNPKVVIPHHQDNFYPPISTMVNTDSFSRLVKMTNPDTKIRVMELNESVNL